MPEDPESKPGGEGLYSHLLAEVHRQDPFGVLKGWKAVKAVLKLHTPVTVAYDPFDNGHLTSVECSECGSPCETVRVIASALGVET